MDDVERRGGDANCRDGWWREGVAIVRVVMYGGDKVW